jgi:hypothetical protein
LIGGFAPLITNRQRFEVDDDMGEEWKEGCYRQALEDYLLEAVEQWRHDRSASWSNALGTNDILDRCENLWDVIQPFEKQEIFKAIEHFGRCILESSPGIGDSGPLTQLGVDGEPYYSCPDFLHYTKESVQICLAEALAAKFGEAASRLVDLSEEEAWRTEGLKLSENAQKFLHLVWKTYVCGFDASCIAVCRSAIEEVLRNKIDDATLEKRFGKRGSHQQVFSLKDYIQVARLEGLLSEELAKEADTIRVRANKVLHTDPGLTEKTKESISMTVGILFMMDTGRDPWHPEL